MRCRELDIFRILEFFSDIVWKFFGNCLGFFLEDFFGRIFWEDFLRGFLEGLLLEEFFWRNYLFYLDVEGIDLFVKILVFVEILSKSKKEEF